MTLLASGTVGEKSLLWCMSLCQEASLSFVLSCSVFLSSLPRKRLVSKGTSVALFGKDRHSNQLGAG